MADNSDAAARASLLSTEIVNLIKFKITLDPATLS